MGKALTGSKGSSGPRSSEGRSEEGVVRGEGPTSRTEKPCFPVYPTYKESLGNERISFIFQKDPLAG